MDLSKISSGEKLPEQINVIIEIPALSSSVKYEVDKHSGGVEVDRFMNTPMHYPCNYGFVPQTIAEDGDPLDVLVLTPFPLLVGCFIQCHPIDVLEMTDESGRDIKLLVKPVSGMHSGYDDVNILTDLPSNLSEKIVHFFKHYKELDANKWTEVGEWLGKERAYSEILLAAERYRKQ